MIPIKDHKNLYRDEKSGAVVNGDTSGFTQYKKMKLLKLTHREEIDKIKEDISEIKDLLKQFLKK
tara:strand:- start:615 stop:809 length:195 start_codon:yes stop_codon:yes gene_type:complete